MRAKAYKFVAIVIRLALEQNEIRPDAAVAVIVPFTGQWVIEIAGRQRRPFACFAGYDSELALTIPTIPDSGSNGPPKQLVP